ncbi:glycosyl transferase group 1 [Stanieria cyanosphaera PCC 7437]|uniref:Glycosyl transferase group 1 n=1 Tax=Stanieria cyanosphaera (strain ATCC 29371 / PCC 7437) TaxID=111780 RepID=K9XR28_STAC7|nr:glycosyltransferase [Stanieria cyanosphaera]AFZ34993.1 glycosyl transferase group 1 [Stanieria cyanosphaera PCC 7437]
MKIAIISSGFLPVVDGVSIAVFNRLIKLSKWGHQVLLFCPDYSPLLEIYPDWQNYTGNILPGVKVISLPSVPAIALNFERDPTAKSYQIVLDQLQQFQPDIIHVDEPERLATRFLRLPGVAFAKQAGISCVSFFHTNYIDYAEDYFPLPRLLMRLFQSLLKLMFARIYNSYDLTLVATEITKKKVRQMGINNVLQDRLLGINLNEFNSVTRQNNFWQKQYNISEIDHKIKLICIGRLTPDKGWNFTLNVFEQLAKEIELNNLAIIIIGEGDLKEKIAEKFSQLTSNFYLLGRVSPTDIPALLVNSDIYMTASEKETTGLTILEASAAGIPIIAPSAGGVIDNIIDGKTGFIFEPQNIDDFLSKLKLLIAEQHLRQAMGNEGKNFVAKFDWDKAVNNLLKIWQKQIEEKEHKFLS